MVPLQNGVRLELLLVLVHAISDPGADLSFSASRLLAQRLLLFPGDYENADRGCCLKQASNSSLSLCVGS